MPSPARTPPRRIRVRRTAAALAVAVLLGAVAAPGAAARPLDAAAAGRVGSAWVWPVDDVRLVRPFVAPPHRYGAGHRGLDLRPEHSTVRAPASGVVAFAGAVAGRGVLTIDHGDGLVTTLEPVVPSVVVGTAVAGGEVVGALGLGGHAASGTLHFGVREDGEYINPLRLLGGVPRAVLLPCC